MKRQERRVAAGGGRTWAALAVILGLVFLLGQAHGAAVFFAGKLDEKGEFVPDKDVKNPCYSIQYCTVTTDIADGHARTTILLDVVSAAEKAVDTVLIVPLPKGCESFIADSARSPVLILMGKAGVALRTEYLPAADAQKVYEAIAKATNSARVLALSGRHALMVPSFALQPKNQLTVKLNLPVNVANGLCEYECPMPATGFATAPVARLTVTAVVRDSKPLRAVFSPTHDVAVDRKSLYEATVRVAADNWFGGGMLRLLYVADESPLGLRVIAHRAEGEDEGYFLLIANPTGDPKGGKVIEKDVLLALDTSGSMRGEKMEQASSAVEYCLKNLNPGDRFNIIAFGTDVKSFRDGLVPKSDANLRAASNFIDELVPAGRTNISGALAKGLAGAPEKGRPRIMIFLTDGTPTEGELVPENIVKQLPELNASKTRLFVMGLGNDVNAHLLDQLAELTEGGSEYVAPQEEIDVKVAALYNRLSNPVLTNVELAFGDLMTNSVYPRKVSALFKGSQIMVAGRYRGSGAQTVTVSGTLAGEPVKYTCLAEFPGKAAPQNDYVAPLWAARKIGFLLQEIRLHGENKELIDEVIALSKTFGIVTEYTEFIAMSGKDMTEREIAEEAGKRMKDARAEASGQWAVNQANNDRALQGRMSAAPSANTFVDRRGNTRTVDNVQQVGRRAFYLRDGKWEDAEGPGDRAVRKVKLFSKDYFDLVRTDEDFRNAQNVGDGLSINVGKERIVVEK